MDTSAHLRDQLVSLLKWDGVVADGVTAAISQASSRKEIDVIVQDYIGSHVEARKAIERFADTKFPAEAAPPPRARPSVGPPPPVSQLSDEDLKASIYMGANVKTKIKRQSKQPAAPSTPTLERKVLNCLSCGKIFDCRRPGTDAMRFLSSGGVCTFCGNRVRLAYTDGSTNITPEEEISQEIALKEAQTAAAVASEAEAVALRDRLVDFDRQAAKRTTVIDDQSDYFAIDSNAWLTDEERAELKRREAAVEAAAEAAKKRITVTVDLLGRRVIMDNGAGDDAQASGSGDGAIGAAMAATLAERPQGGGAAAAGPQQAQREPHMTVCPSMAAARYTFVPKEKAGGGAGGKEKQKEKKKPMPKLPVSRLQHDGALKI